MKSRYINRRLSTWDYSQRGMYFVTICTHERRPVLGTIKTDPDVMGLNAEFIPSEIGTHCSTVAESISARYPGASFEKLIIMPDHIHALIAVREDAPLLGKVVFTFKKKVTTKAHNAGFQGKLWQSNYYDHIVRNEQDALRIMGYMDENPLKWALGKHDTQEEIAASFLCSE